MKWLPRANSSVMLGVAVAICAASAFADSLSAGSDANGCHNMISPGQMQSCVPKNEAPQTNQPSQVPDGDVPDSSSSVPKIENKPDAKSKVIGGVSEAEVDEYLQNYGKPPREAVRALINPTDENIQALTKWQQRQQVLTTYMGQQMTQLQQPSGTTGMAISQANLPYFIGMKVVLYITFPCAACDKQVKALQDTAADNPAFDGKVVLIGNFDKKQLVEVLAKHNVSLLTEQVSIESAQKQGITNVPVITVTDTRSGNKTIAINNVVDASSLSQIIVSFRKQNEKLKGARS